MTSIIHAPITNEEKNTYKIFVEVPQINTSLETPRPMSEVASMKKKQ